MLFLPLQTLCILRTKILFIIILAAVCLIHLISPSYAAESTSSQVDLLNPSGLSTTREYEGAISPEYIDRFTGRVQLHHVDLELPGNGGFDLKVERAYNFTQYRGEPDGLGQPNAFGVDWDISYGRIYKNAGDLCARSAPAYSIQSPVLELPDGSKQTLYYHADQKPALYTTKNNWIANCSEDGLGLIVKAPNGFTYEMGEAYDAAVLPQEISLVFTNSQALVTKKITDPHGNYALLTYNTVTGGRQKLISTITTNDGRKIVFNYSPSNLGMWQLNSIVSGDKTVTYAYSLIQSYTMRQSAFWHLKSVIRPDGSTWNYEYYSNVLDPWSRAIQKVTSPEKGWVQYEYVYKGYDGDPFYFTPLEAYADPSGRKSFLGRKTTSDGGVWTYYYYRNADFEDVVLERSNYDLSVYKYYGHILLTKDADKNNRLWKLGNQIDKSIYPLPTTPMDIALDKQYIATTIPKQQEKLTWISRVITPNQYDYYAPVKFYDEVVSTPVLAQKIITLDNTTYTTVFSNWDAYGNPQTIIETGQGTRTKSIAYNNNTAKWIIGQPDSETLNVKSADVGAVNELIGSITHTYDPNTGNMLSENKYGVINSYTYHNFGNIDTHTDPRGNITKFEDYYRGVPRLITQNLDGSPITITRQVSDAGNITLETDQENHSTSYAYDAMNRVTSITPATGSSTSIVYQNATNTTPLTINIKRNAQDLNTKTYDGFGRLRTATNAPNTVYAVLSKTDYDPIGRPSKIYSPVNTSTTPTLGDSFIYDALGRPLTITHADNSVDSTSYLSNNTVQSTNANGKVWQHIYRSFGDPAEKQLMQVIAPSTKDANGATVNNTTSITRNGLGLVKTITQNGVTRSTNYDNRYFVQSEVQPEIGTITYTRDAAGNMRTRQIGAQNPTIYAYDTLNHLKNITYPTLANNISTPNVSYDYYKTGKLKNVTSTAATRNFIYDANNNLTNENLSLDGKVYPIAYGYNTFDQLTSLTYPSGRIVNYNPNLLGQATIANDGANSFVKTINYHPTGSIKTIQFGNNTQSTTALNNRNWPSNFSTTQINSAGTVLATYQNSNYSSYDKVGNVLNISDPINSSWNRTITYDELDRVKSVIAPAGTSTLNYNGNGDITNYNLIGAGNIPTLQRSYIYNPNTRRLDTVSFNGTNRSFSYDAQGNTTANGQFTFVYDAADNLRCIGPCNANNTYTYDGNDQQVKSSIAGKITYNIYTAKGQLLSQDIPSQGKRTDIIYIGNQKIASINTYPSNSQCVMPFIATFHTDPAGSPLLATDNAGKVLWTENYAPFGDRYVKAKTGTNTQFFHGKEQDSSTGLQYFGARWYDPSIGRFMGVDPAGLDAEDKGDSGLVHEFNRYAFSANNPYKYTDPDGRNSTGITQNGLS